jgi:hypothetical protein
LGVTAPFGTTTAFGATGTGAETTWLAATATSGAKAPSEATAAVTYDMVPAKMALHRGFEINHHQSFGGRGPRTGTL